MKKMWLLAFAFLSDIHAAGAAVVWQGDAVIDSATSQCTAEQSIGPAAGRITKTVLRPLNLSDNGINTTITFIANQSAMFAMVLDQGAMPSGTAATFGNNASGVKKANVGTIYSNFLQLPAVIAVDTTDVRLSGTINDFLYVTGCTVNFRAAYTKRND